jgi:hypothetical protein
MTGAALICGARIAASHDGSAELVVELRYDNGGTTEVTLDQMAARALMENCRAISLDDLSGHTWHEVKRALEYSWNRSRAR